MTHQQAHRHADAKRPDATHDDDLGPGRESRSAQLKAPEHPIESGLIQRKARDGNGVAEGADAAVATASSSSGHALPETLMRKFEGSLGADLSGVRVHTGAESASAAEAVSARAYTVGQDIHFAAGQYDPSSSTGEHLLAHEVAHTVQQRGGSPTRQNKLTVSSSGDLAECEADRAADAMVSGTAAQVTTATGPLHRKEEAPGPSGEAKPDRADGEAAPGGSPLEVPLSWSTPGFEFMDKEAGEYAKVKGEWSAGVSAKYKNAAAVAESKEKAEKRDAGKEVHSGPEATGGISKTGGDMASLKVEVEQELASGWHGIDLKVNYADLKYSAKKFSLGTCPLIASTKWGPVTFERQPIAFELISWEPGKEPELATVKSLAKAKIPVHQFTSKSGSQLDIDASVTVTFEVMPNYAKIVEWLTEHLAETAIEGLAETAALVGSIAAFTYASIEAFKEMEQLQTPIVRMAEDASKATQKYAAFVIGHEKPEREAERRVAARVNADLARVAASLGRTPDDIRPVLRRSTAKLADLSNTAMVSAKNACFAKARDMVDQYWGNLSWFERTVALKDKAWLYGNVAELVEKSFSMTDPSNYAG